MAPKNKLKQVPLKLLSTAGKGYFYIASKNPKKITHKLQFMKHDPIVRRNVLFTETKINKSKR